MNIHDVAFGIFCRLAPMQDHLELSGKVRAKAELAYTYADAFMATMDDYIRSHPEAEANAAEPLATLDRFGCWRSRVA